PGSTDEMRQFELGYPNHEVKIAFLSHLLDKFSNLKKGRGVSHVLTLIRALRTDDLDLFFRTLKVFFANIKYDLHLPYEKYYHSILYLALSLMGEPIDAEVQTDVGRIDMVVNLDNHIYLFEFKLDKTAQDALNQIHQKKYYQKYLLDKKPITLIGANFSSTEKTVDEWICEELTVDS
ncbi:MAG: PD-(D/E)XK nuclease domain-containing protein, partial [Chloroflexota bacterium]